LLPAACFIQLHQDVGASGFEVGRGIVERKMTILANTCETDIDVVHSDQGIEAGDFICHRGRRAIDGDKGFGHRQVREQAFLQVVAETRRMVGRETDIFIQMENGDTRPLDAALLNQCIDHFELAGASGNDHARR